MLTANLYGPPPTLHTDELSDLPSTADLSVVLALVIVALLAIWATERWGILAGCGLFLVATLAASSAIEQPHPGITHAAPAVLIAAGVLAMTGETGEAKVLGALGILAGIVGAIALNPA